MKTEPPIDQELAAKLAAAVADLKPNGKGEPPALPHALPAFLRRPHANRPPPLPERVELPTEYRRLPNEDDEHSPLRLAVGFNTYHAPFDHLRTLRPTEAPTEPPETRVELMEALALTYAILAALERMRADTVDTLADWCVVQEQVNAARLQTYEDEWAVR